jgi:hypothetical protein
MVFGALLCALAVGAMLYINIATVADKKTVRFDGSGTMFAAELGLAHDGSACQIAPDSGQGSSVDLPPPAGASTYDTRYRGRLFDVSGPATVTCSGRELLVATGLGGRLLSVNHLPAGLFVVGAILAVVARTRLRQPAP